uniref:Uncharacterized protein n=1 Tax=Arundo donax TaxID=35708 RepID=A0A0A9CKE9_ARUDO
MKRGRNALVDSRAAIRKGEKGDPLYMLCILRKMFLPKGRSKDHQCVD